MAKAAGYNFPKISKPIIAIVGGFGSGKTEISVNLARHYALTGQNRIVIADLDLVNPYFRSREVINEMEQLGVKTIAPEGGHHYADLPILLPEIKGLIENPLDKVIIDVGGDAQGTKALGSLSGYFRLDKYEMLMVINSRRPQTEDLEISLKTMTRVETTAGLKFTGLIANSHLIDETTPEIVMEGYELAQKISSKSGLPICFISTKETLLSSMSLDRIECAILPLKRSMLKPWET
jgi:hypothetical protein